MAILLVIEACQLPQRDDAFQTFHIPAIDHRLVLFLSCLTSPESPARVPTLEPESKSLPLRSLIDTRGRIPSLSSSRSVALGGGSPSRVAISTKFTVRSGNPRAGNQDLGHWPFRGPAPQFSPDLLAASASATFQVCWPDVTPARLEGRRASDTPLPRVFALFCSRLCHISSDSSPMRGS